jgi:antitoxin VapB
METAKVFTTGRSQAVRIPKRFRFKTDVLLIRKQGNSVILTPPPEITWSEFFAKHTCPDFELDRGDIQDVQERETLK